MSQIETTNYKPNSTNDMKLETNQAKTKNDEFNHVLYNEWYCVISSEKQDNGLWGMPLQCVKMDRIPMSTSEENWLKHSAICIGIAETYRDETFELFWTDEKGFFVKLSKSGMKKIRYDDYILEENILTWACQ